jgi:DNA-binding beta-propeller fold protein YncE
VEDVFDLPGFCFGLVYDEINQYVYYSDDDAQIVYRNNLQGTDEVEIISGLGGPRDLALDAENGFLYVVDRSNDAVVEVDLSDNSSSILYDVNDDPLFLLPVGIDYYDGNVYVTAVDFDAETVWKGDVGGGGIEKIIDFSAGGFGYGVEVDKENEKIYFDDNDGLKILRSDLDGSNIETVGNTTDRTYGIAIGNNGRYYWAGRDGVIRIANLDGSEEDILNDVAVDIRGMIFRESDN